MAKKKVVINSGKKKKSSKTQSTNQQTYSNARDARRAQIREAESKLDRLKEMEEKQTRRENVILSFVMNYAEGIAVVGVISMVCIYMLYSMNSILPDYMKDQTGLVVVVVIVIVAIWALMIIFEIRRMNQRHKKRKT